MSWSGFFLSTHKLCGRPHEEFLSEDECFERPLDKVSSADKQISEILHLLELSLIKELAACRAPLHVLATNLVFFRLPLLGFFFESGFEGGFFRRTRRRCARPSGRAAVIALNELRGDEDTTELFAGHFSPLFVWLSSGKLVPRKNFDDSKFL